MENVINIKQLISKLRHETSSIRFIKLTSALDAVLFKRKGTRPRYKYVLCCDKAKPIILSYLIFSAPVSYFYIHNICHQLRLISSLISKMYFSKYLTKITSSIGQLVISYTTHFNEGIFYLDFLKGSYLSLR